MSAEVISVAPPEIRIDELTSGAEYVKSRRLVEILPDSQSEYGSGNGQYRATFNIGSSGIEFLDGLNSYLKCDLSVINATGTPADYRVSSFLDEGGIHSLIRSVTIQTRNGIRLEHIDHYNKLYAMIRNATLSRSHVNEMSGPECGDSVGWRATIDPDFFLSDDNVQNDAPTDGQLSLNLPGLTAGAGPPATAAGWYTMVSGVRVVRPARARLGHTTAVTNPQAANKNTVAFQLLSDFLTSLKYLPLPMLGQLQVVIEFERANLGMFMTKRKGNRAYNNILTTDTMNYKIENLRFCCNFVEMADVVLSEYEKAWSGPGISIPYQTYRAFQRPLSASGGSFEVQFGVNSARYLLIAIMADYSFTDSENAKSWHSNSWFMRQGLRNYRVLCGGRTYPANGPVDISNTNFAAEPFMQLMSALNQQGNTLNDTCIRIHQLDNTIARSVSGPMPEGGSEDAITGKVDFTDTTKFMLGFDLTEVDTFSGLNTVGNNLVVDLNFAAAPPAYGRNALAFLCYDSVFTLQKSSGVLVRY